LILFLAYYILKSLNDILLLFEASLTRKALLFYFLILIFLAVYTKLGLNALETFKNTYIFKKEESD